MTTETIHKDEKLKILSLEDSARDFELIKELLIDAGYCLSITWVETEDAFVASLRDQTWDLILADFKLPGFDAFGALRLRNEICPDTPFICVSGSIGEETAIELLKAGAVDYVLKDRPDRLPFAVERALKEARQKKIRQQNTGALQEADRQLRASQSATLNILEDLKAENQARQAREAELQRITLAVEQAGEMVFITDLDGTIQYVNPAVTAVSGYSREEVIGQNTRLFKSGQQVQSFYRELWGTIASGKIWNGQLVNKRKDGTLYTEAATISPVKDASGQILSYVAVKRDITEHLNIEKQLRQAQKMESIGVLAGGVAHDFNNILSVIIGYGEMSLMKMAADNPFRNNVEQMLAAADRATHLTKDLLIFSRQKECERKPVDLNNCIGKMEDFLKRILRENICYRTHLLQTGLPILADSHQIDQIIMNLAINAQDAMPDNGVFTITTDKIELDEHFVAIYGYGKPGWYARLDFSDNGTGMNEATRHKIFEPFFTTKEVGKGTGLGLAVVYGIVKQHDGFINVYSEPGKGTTFHLYLPLLPECVENSSGKTPKELPAGGSETILLAEDNDMVLNMTTIVLQSAGYCVISAVDGLDAVEKFRVHGDTIDLLLFDLIMPKMNGMEAYDHIAKIRPELKVIFASGYAPDTVVSSIPQIERTSILSKPAPPDELLRLVRQVLDGVNDLT